MLRSGEFQTNTDCSRLCTLRPGVGMAGLTGKHSDQTENTKGPHWNPSFICFWFGDHAFLLNSHVFQLYDDNEYFPMMVT